MVLETLRKSLSDFSDKITSPVDTITEVTSSMKKKVIGPDANLLDLIENNLRYIPYTTVIKKQFTKLTTQVKKLKMAATKKTSTINALSLLQAEIAKITDFAEATKNVPVLLQVFERHLKKGSLPTAYEKGKFVLGTTSLSAKDTNSVLTLFQEAQVEITATLVDLQKPFTEQYSLPLPGQYDHKAAKKNFHATWKQAIDTLIDDEYEVSKLQKKLLYTTDELARQQRLLNKALSDKRTGKSDKGTTRRLNHAKQRIQVLITKDIPGGLRAIDAALKKVVADEKIVQDSWKTYTTNYATWSKKVQTWLHGNHVQTKKVITSATSKRVSLKKKLDKEIASLTRLYTKSTTTLNKDTSYTNADAIKQLLKQDIAASDTYTLDYIDMLTSYAEQIQHHHKDLDVYALLLQDRTAYTYGTQLLEKQRVIQLKLLLGIKKRHADLSNQIWHNLLDVENKIDTSLAESIKHTKQHAEACKQQRKTYEKEIGTRTQAVKNYSTALKELRRAERTYRYTAGRLASLYSAEVNKAYAQALQTLQQAGKEHITALKKIQKKLTSDLEEQKKTVKNLEQKTSPTTQDKKAIKVGADTLHRGELYLDIIAHHLSTEQEHQDDATQLIKSYTKVASNQEKRKVFYEKQASAGISKSSKNIYFKETLTQPKKVTGKRI